MVYVTLYIVDCKGYDTCRYSFLVPVILERLLDVMLNIEEAYVAMSYCMVYKYSLYFCRIRGGYRISEREGGSG